MPLIADQKVEALNRLTRAVHDSVPYWKEGYDPLFDGDKTEWMIERMISHDIEVVSELENLLRIIIEEKTLLDQK